LSEEAAQIDCKVRYQVHGLEKHSLQGCSEWVRGDGGEGTVVPVGAREEDAAETDGSS